MWISICKRSWQTLKQAVEQGARLALFPELSLTGYSCADLFYQSLLRDNARAAALKPLAEASAHPRHRRGGGIAAGGGWQAVQLRRVPGRGPGAGPRPQDLSAHHQRVLRRALVHLWSSQPPWIEVTDRWLGCPLRHGLALHRQDNLPGCVIGIEICEDLWAVEPPSGEMALAGATILLNPSASNELLGKVDYRRELVRQQSARCLAAYCYAGAGPGESTTDTVWAGHSLIAENGSLLAETERFRFETQMAVADIDVQRLQHERLRNSTFSAVAGEIGRFATSNSLCRASGRLGTPPTLLRPDLHRTPFVPADPDRRAEHCREIFEHPGHGAGQTAAPHRLPAR